MPNFITCRFKGDLSRLLSFLSLSACSVYFLLFIFKIYISVFRVTNTGQMSARLKTFILISPTSLILDTNFEL